MGEVSIKLWKKSKLQRYPLFQGKKKRQRQAIFYRINPIDNAWKFQWENMKLSRTNPEKNHQSKDLLSRRDLHPRKIKLDRSPPIRWWKQGHQRKKIEKTVARIEVETIDGLKFKIIFSQMIPYRSRKKNMKKLNKQRPPSPRPKPSARITEAFSEIHLPLLLGKVNSKN